MYSILVAFGQNHIQAPAIPINAVMCTTALTTHIIAMSQAWHAHPMSLAKQIQLHINSLGPIRFSVNLCLNPIRIFRLHAEIGEGRKRKECVRRRIAAVPTSVSTAIQLQVVGIHAYMHVPWCW